MWKHKIFDELISNENDFIRLTLSEELTAYKEALKDDEILKQIQKPFWTAVKEKYYCCIACLIYYRYFFTGVMVIYPDEKRTASGRFTTASTD